MIHVAVVDGKPRVLDGLFGGCDACHEETWVDAVCQSHARENAAYAAAFTLAGLVAYFVTERVRKK